MLQKYDASILTDALEAATVYLGSCLRGRIIAVLYAPTTIDGGATLTITGETTGVPILTKANAGTDAAWFYPRAVCHKVADGAEITDSAADICVYDERVKVVIASGGAAATGTITLLVDDDL